MVDDRKKIDMYVQELIDALGEESSRPAKTKQAHPLMSSPVWFVVTLIALCINFLLVAVIFWQRLQIDYLVSKIIGE